MAVRSVREKVIVNGEPYLSVQEACDALRVTKPTLYRYWKDEGLESVLTGGRRRFPLYSLSVWCLQHLGRPISNAWQL